MKVKIEILKDEVTGEDIGFMPERKGDAAGFDLRAPMDGVLYCGEQVLIPLGIKLEIESGYEGQLRTRSGIARDYSVFVVNQPGTIDADFRGEIGAMLINLGKKPFAWKRNERLIQVVYHKLPFIVHERVPTLTTTVRGDGGFGSTGRA